MTDIVSEAYKCVIENLDYIIRKNIKRNENIEKIISDVSIDSLDNDINKDIDYILSHISDYHC
jgi:hypothetical protein